jgi:hypothetical protein
MRANAVSRYIPAVVSFVNDSTRAAALFATILLAAFFGALLSAPALAQDAAIANLPLPQTRITQPIDETQLTRLRGNTHPLARPQFDLGTAPATLPMERMLLVLKRGDDQEHALRTLLDDQQDKFSTNYHKWLTPEQFGKSFGPSDADMQTIVGWLQSHGFQVAAPSKGRTVIEFSGSASQVQQAFHTTIHKYLVNGEQHWANASDPSIPTALTPAVVGIDTLHNFRHKPMNVFHGIGTREKATGRVTMKGKPEFTFGPGGTNPCNPQDANCYSVAPFDFATIYNVLPQWNANIDGTGQRIAIVQEANIDITNARSFRSLFNLPTNDPNVILNGPDPGLATPGSGLDAEANLDVQWAGAVAKGATIDLVVSAFTDTTAGIDLSALYVVDNNLDGIVSESFGDCEQVIGLTEDQFYDAVWEQAAAQGISVFLSSGDSGSAGCDLNFPPNEPDQGNQPNQPGGLAVSGFGSTPFNVSVGGTDFQDAANPESFWNATNSANQASALGYIPEATWNSTCSNALVFALFGFSSVPETNCNNSQLSNFLAPVGGGGGISTLYSSPPYQSGAISTLAGGMRAVPDVSLFASSGFSGNAYLFCLKDVSQDGSCDLNAPFTDIAMAGGTSFGSPAFAGIMALINQKTGSRQGNPNYALYKLAAQVPAANCNSTSGPATNCIFNDVTAGTIQMPCAAGSSANCASTAGDAVGILSGYQTGVGYDLATGLGTVNVDNLVNQWTSAKFAATTTSLTLNGGTAPVTVPHSTSVNVVITVAGLSGTPTGDASLIAQSGPSVSSQTGVAMYTLGGGSTGPVATILPGGTYDVRAHYGGDATFGSSDSTAPGIKVTVTPEGSNTSLTDIAFNPFSGNQILGNTFPFGSLVFVQAAVAGNSGQGVPTGKVQFTAAAGSAGVPTQGLGINNLSPVTIANPSALNSLGSTTIGPGLVNFDAGSYNISAQYQGDASFTASSAGAVTFTIQPGFALITVPNGVVISAPGQSGTTSIGIVASTGFTNAVTVTCSGLPAGVACNMPPITPNGPNAIEKGTITITTTAAAARRAMVERNRSPYLFAAIL